MSPAKYVTIMMIPDGAEARRGIRVRQWVLKLIIALLGVLLCGMILFFSLYGKVLMRAAQADRLISENERLRRYEHKVQLMEDNLNQAREIVERVAQLAGIDYEFPELPDDSIILAGLGGRSVAILRRSTESDLSQPSGQPMQGFITQDFEVEDTFHYHPGIDIACTVGDPVLATAAGTVIYAGPDSTYGNMVVIEHNDSVVTVYGHNAELLVSSGDKVMAGSRIALCGNTGKSTAPHLHYEVRVNNEPINPLED